MRTTPVQFSEAQNSVKSHLLPLVTCIQILLAFRELTNERLGSAALCTCLLARESVLPQEASARVQVMGREGCNRMAASKCVAEIALQLCSGVGSSLNAQRSTEVPLNALDVLHVSVDDAHVLMPDISNPVSCR